MQTIIAGSTIRFYTSTPFTEADGVTVADPTQVKFGFSVAGQPTQWLTYAPGGGLGSIIKDAVGTYHVDIDTTGMPGQWVVTWVGVGVVTARAEWSIFVAPPSVT